MVAHRIEPASGDQLNAPGQMNPVLYHSSRLMIIFVEHAQTGFVWHTRDRLNGKRLNRLVDILRSHVVIN